MIGSTYILSRIWPADMIEPLEYSLLNQFCVSDSIVIGGKTLMASECGRFLALVHAAKASDALFRCDLRQTDVRSRRRSRRVGANKSERSGIGDSTEEDYMAREGPGVTSTNKPQLLNASIADRAPNYEKQL